MNAYELSSDMGKSSSYLSVYRHLRKLPKGMSAKDVHKAYLDERLRKEALIFSLQEVLFELQATRQSTAFGRHLQAIGLYESKRAITSISLNLFSTRKNSPNITAVAKYEKVLEEYRKWRSGDE